LNYSADDLDIRELWRALLGTKLSASSKNRDCEDLAEVSFLIYAEDMELSQVDSSTAADQ